MSQIKEKDIDFRKHPPLLSVYMIGFKQDSSVFCLLKVSQLTLCKSWSYLSDQRFVLSKSVGFLHKHTKLAILALLLILFSNTFAVSLIICTINVK